MDQEVISIHIGQAGVQMGSAIWELLKIEHEIDYDGNLLCFCQWPLKDNTTSLFYESMRGYYVPRALFVDSDPIAIDQIRYNPCGPNIPPHLFVAGTEDGSGNFGRGYNLVGDEIINTIMDKVNSLETNAERLSGYILYHAMSGGTGSGLTCRVVEKLKDNNPKIPIVSLCIFPSPSLTTNIIEIYNAILANAAYGNDSDIMICVDNESLYKVCKNHLQIPSPNYVNINRRLSQIASSLTTSYRYYGCLSANFSIFQTNLIPFPETRYPFIAYSSYGCVESNLNVNDITWQTFSRPFQTLSVNPIDGTYMSCCLLYRGRHCSPANINAALHDIKADENINFMDWVPNSFKVAINSQMPGYVPKSDICMTDKALCNLANHTGIAQVFDLITDRFTKSYERKAYLHWYKEAGIEESFFKDSLNIMIKVTNSYKALESTLETSNANVNQNSLKTLSKSNTEISITKYRNKFREMLKKGFKNQINIVQSKAKKFKDINVKTEFLLKFIRDSSIDESLMKYSKLCTSNESNSYFSYSKFLISQQLPITHNLPAVAVRKAFIQKDVNSNSKTPVRNKYKLLSKNNTVEHSIPKIKKIETTKKTSKCSKKQSDTISDTIESQSKSSKSQLNMIDMYIDALTNISSF